MIQLTKLNGTEFTLNSDLIETIYENPDTTIRLTNGPIYIVKETRDEITQKTIKYHQEIFKNLITTGMRNPNNEENNILE